MNLSIRFKVKKTGMVFQQIRNAPTGAYSYVLGNRNNRSGAVLDPVEESQDVLLAVLDDLALDLHLILLTRAHSVSVQSAVSLRNRAGGAIIAGPDCDYLEAVSRAVHGRHLTFGDEVVHVIGTPGNTRYSLCYRWRDRIFTGDTLLIASCSNDSVPCEDPGSLFDSVTTRLFALPPETLIYPGLDMNGRTVSTISEEKASHPCFSNRSRDSFVALMSK